MSAKTFDITKSRKFGSVRVIHEENRVVVRLYQTDIVVLSEEGVRLSTNGWTTVTTKTAMNNALRQFGTELSVYQRKGLWFVSFGNGVSKPFVDGMNIAIKNRFQILSNLLKVA
jgi:hypothetical protein